jgi:GNAT superfamily N-acetyltransferase
VNRPDIRLRDWRPTDSIEALTLLLHRAYDVWARVDLRYLATHQSPAVTLERIQAGRCIVADCAGAVVGTVCYYSPGAASASTYLRRTDVAHFGQLAVEPSFQGAGLGRRLIARAERLAKDEGARELALDTAEPATLLVAWYERLGYQVVDHVSWEETNYRSVVMSKRL